MEQIKNKEFNNKFYLLKRQFSYNEQGYNVIKLMFFKLIIEEVDGPFLYSGWRIANISEVFCEVRNVLEANMEKIESRFGGLCADLVKQCIVSFSTYAGLNSGLENILQIIDSLSQDEIIDFVLHEVDTLDFEYKNDLTPKSLCDLVGRLLKKYENSTWLDICCGNGTFLVDNALKYPEDMFIGVDINFNATLLTKIRLVFAKVKNKVVNDNILNNTYADKADIVFGNFPFNLKMSYAIREADQYKKQCEYVGTVRLFQTQEWLFVDTVLQLLKKEGKGAVILPEGLLANVRDIEQRRCLIEQNLVETIIKLPQNLFAYTGIPLVLVVLSKNKNNSNIKFVNATNMCFSGRLSVLNVDEIIDEIENGGENSISISLDEIVQNDYNLSMQKYIDLSAIKIKNPVMLGDYTLEIFRGIQLNGSRKHEFVEGLNDRFVYKLIGPGDIEDGTFDPNKISKYVFEKDLDKYIIKNNDVMLATKSTKVKVAIAEIKDDEMILPSGSMVIIRCNKEKLNPAYLKAFLDSSIGQKLLAGIQTGSVIISVNPSALKKMTISLAPMDRQIEIGKNLWSKIDSVKIQRKKLEKLELELNNLFDSMEGDEWIES